VFNAANEVCVEAFLAGHLPFVAIVDTVSAVLDAHLSSAAGTSDAITTVEQVLAADRWAREAAVHLLAEPVAR
jgi:1-deoxy-D-xylulose-5-phosphate reductoisomerase